MDTLIQITNHEGETLGGSYISTGSILPAVTPSTSIELLMDANQSMRMLKRRHVAQVKV